jgi:hypothetical protein
MVLYLQAGKVVLIKQGDGSVVRVVATSTMEEILVFTYFKGTKPRDIGQGLGEGRKIQ